MHIEVCVAGYVAVDCSLHITCVSQKHIVVGEVVVTLLCECCSACCSACCSVCCRACCSGLQPYITCISQKHIVIGVVVVVCSVSQDLKHMLFFHNLCCSCCSVSQCVAWCCMVLQCVAVVRISCTCSSSTICRAVVAMCCRWSQCVTVYYSSKDLMHMLFLHPLCCILCSVTQRVQCVATCCSDQDLMRMLNLHSLVHTC